MEAVAFAFGLQDVAAVRQAVQRNAGEAFAPQDLGPVLEGEVGRHDQAVPLICRRDDIEQQFRSRLAGGNVAEFVEDQEVKLAQRLSVTQQLPLLLGFEQLGDEFGDAEEPRLAALGAGGHAQGGGEVRLAGSRGADEQHVLAVVEVVPFDQLEHERFVDARPGGEVELVEQLGGGEPGRLQSSLGRLAFAFEQFQFAKLEQVRQMIRVVGGATLGDLLAFVVHRRQLEVLQVVFQQHSALGVGLGHGVASSGDDEALDGWPSSSD